MIKDSIYNLKHELKLIKGKRVMVCIDHYCNISGMSEYEYYRKKRATKEADGST